MARRTSIAEPAPALYPGRHGDLALCECRPCLTRRQLHAFSKGGVLAPGEQSEPPDVIFARCLAFIHPFLSSGAAGPLGRHWGPSKNFRADGTILASRDPMDVLGSRFFQASRIGTGDGRTRIIDPQGAGTGLINRVKESASISSQGLTKSGDGCNP